MILHIPFSVAVNVIAIYLLSRLNPSQVVRQPAPAQGLNEVAG